MHWPEGCGATFQDRNTWTVDPAPRVALPGLPGGMGGVRVRRD